jgi:phage gp36-like protein
MSYSTADKLATRIGPRIYFQLTAEDGSIPDDRVAVDMLRAASLEVDVKIATRYRAPVTQPPAIVDQLAGLEEQIAYWFLWVRRGFGMQDTAASAAKVGYDSAMKTLGDIADGKLDLPGAGWRDPYGPNQVSGTVWGSERPVFLPPNDLDKPYGPFDDDNGPDRW